MKLFSDFGSLCALCDSVFQHLNYKSALLMLKFRDPETQRHREWALRPLRLLQNSG